MAESLAEFFLQHFEAHSREPAYRQHRGYRMETVTYGDVLETACAFARKLKESGVSAGDRVLLWGENSAGWVSAFIGCVLSGVIAVPLDDGSSSDFVLRVQQQTDAKLLVASPVHVREMIQAGFPAPSLCSDEIRNLPSSPPPAHLPDRNDTLQIIFTSGTTATPRGVVITHANVLSNLVPLEKEISGYLKYERIVHPIRFLSLLPLSHVFGQFLGMLVPPILGGTVVFQNELNPSDIIRTIKNERISVLVSVPRVLQSLRQKLERDLESAGGTAKFQERFAAAKDKHFLRRWWRFRSIRRQFGWKFWAMISGGAALDPETEEFWGRLGYAVIQGYGLTETTSLVSVNHPFRLGKGSIGKVLPGREVKLAEDGEILVRGGSVASYWDGAGTTSAADAEGWYRTGDIGVLDEAGNLHLKGRKKEAIVTPGGMKVYPEDLEAALLRQPEVKDCVVVGIEREGNAEACAVVIVRELSDLKAAIERANQSLAEYQRMHLWVEWPEDDFPRTSTQKPRRNLIREFAAAQIRNDGSSSQGGGPLAELIARVSPNRKIDIREDASLDSDLGLSSLDRVELMGAIEDRYQIDLSETRFSSLRTVGDLEHLLRGESFSPSGYHYPRWVLRRPVNWLRIAVHYALMRPALVLLGWPRISGRENLATEKGPLLVISNHIGDMDAGFILTALPARFRHRLTIATGGEALEGLRTPRSGRGFILTLYDRLKWTFGVALLNLFPLPREAGFRRSFAYAGEAVDQGYNVLVFPEGRHTTTGVLLPFRSGIGLLASNLQIPVLPMRIDGLFEIRQSGRKFTAPWRIHVRIGKPMRFKNDEAPEQIARALQESVAAL
jgi:long-chain acyl-CoA synthetase